jgi:DNA polymerase III delta subunit
MIYFIYGEDTFRSGEYLNYLINHYQQNELFYFSFDFADTFLPPLEISELREKLNSQNLFSDTRLIILKNLINATSVKFQAEFLKIVSENKIDSSKSTMLIIYENEGEEKPRASQWPQRVDGLESSETFKWLKKKAKLIKDFPALKGQKLSQWVNEISQKFHLRLDPGARSLILGTFGSDTGLIFFTLKKLSLGQKTLITKQEIEDNAWLPFNNNVFEFLDNLAARKIPLAFHCLLSNIAEDNSQTNMLRLLGLITYEFRNILIVKESKAKTLSELQKQTKIKPYPLKKIMPLVKNFSLDELKKIYQKLLLCDERVKRSLMDPEVALQMLLLDIKQVLTQ